MAGAGGIRAAVEDDLNRRDEVNLAVGHDLDAVTERGHGPVCPAAASVDWDVLVQVGGHVVGAVHILPRKLGGERVKVHVLVWEW